MSLEPPLVAFTGRCILGDAPRGGRCQEPRAECIRSGEAGLASGCFPTPPAHGLTSHPAQTTPPVQLIILANSLNQGLPPSLAHVPLGEGVSQSPPQATLVTVLPVSIGEHFHSSLKFISRFTFHVLSLRSSPLWTQACFLIPTPVPAPGGQMIDVK